MAVGIPKVSEDSKKVLRLIRAHGVCAGWQLMSEARLNTERLSEVATELLNAQLVSASGSLVPQEIEKTFFNVQPSNVRLTEYVLNAP